MSWFSSVFKRKKTVNLEEIDLEDVPEVKEVSVGKTHRCNSCGMNIHPTQKYSKQMGLYFHRQCWKNERKNVQI